MSTMMKNAAMLMSLLVVFGFLFVVAVEMRDFGEPYQANNRHGNIEPVMSSREVVIYNETTKVNETIIVNETNYMDHYMLTEGQNDTGSNNIVTAVVFDYRGFDTLGEATVLFVAVSSIAMLFRRKMDITVEEEHRPKGRRALNTIQPMSRIVRTVSNITVPFIILFGFVIILHGHLTPGGGFQGGAVVASAIALVIVAHGSERAHQLFNKGRFSTGESLGLFFFTMVAFAGIAGGAFFMNTIMGEGGLFGETTKWGVNMGNLNTGGTIPLLNIAVGVEVICAFGIILLSLLKGMEYSRQIDEEASKGGEN